MEKKYTYFISSTFRDLIEERKSVANYVLKIDEIPIGMEQFGAIDTTQWDYITRLIDTSDYFILIVAGSYGSIDKTDPELLSYTHKEFRYARDNKIPIIGVIHRTPNVLRREFSETDPMRVKKLDDFRKEVQASRLVAYYTNPSELMVEVAASITKGKSIFNRPGWVRSTALPADERLNAEIADKTALISELRTALDAERANSKSLLSLVATLENDNRASIALHRSEADHDSAAYVRSLGSHLVEKFMLSGVDRLSEKRTTRADEPSEALGSFSIPNRIPVDILNPASLSDRLETAFTLPGVGKGPNDFVFAFSPFVVDPPAHAIAKIRADRLLEIFEEIRQSHNIAVRPFSEELRLKVTVVMVQRSDRFSDMSNHNIESLGKQIDDIVRWLGRHGFLRAESGRLRVSENGLRLIEIGKRFPLE
ncbi:DUF4062 domain-containing protein [bacterium]|nr:DUF4062 domain-containing protein [bacterium]